MFMALTPCPKHEIHAPGMKSMLLEIAGARREPEARADPSASADDNLPEIGRAGDVRLPFLCVSGARESLAREPENAR